MNWQSARGVNILAQIAKGGALAPPESADASPLLFHAYYDSISVVPDLAPGAEQAWVRRRCSSWAGFSRAIRRAAPCICSLPAATARRSPG